MATRFLRLFLSAAGALLLTLLLNLLLALPAAAGPAAPPLAPPAAPAVIAPAAVATDTFSATVLLTVSAAAPVVGDAVTVTAQLVTTGTCRFALYDVTLNQEDPLFTYIDPPRNVIGPPGPNPARWQLAAAQSGVTTFTVSFYGETFCDGVWQWTYVNSAPQAVTVTGFRLHLPWVSYYVPPIPVIDLGTLGGDESVAMAINNRGEIAGASRLAGGFQQHAVLWHDGAITGLGTLGGNYSWATAINDRGEVVGSSNLLGPLPLNHAFIWASGVMTDLGNLGGSAAAALDINLAGQVIGTGQDARGYSRSFIWAGGVMTDIGTLGGDGVYPLDLNDRGQVVGYSQAADGAEHAFLWQNGAMRDLNPEGASSSQATAINARGQVAGTYKRGDEQRAFLWAGGVFTDIGGESVVASFTVDALNERGEVIVYGSLDRASSAFSVFHWRDGNLTKLGDIGYGVYCPALLNDNGLIVLDSPAGPVLWQDGIITPLQLLSGFNEEILDCPQAINNRGQIVGSSRAANGEYHAVLWEVAASE